MANPITEFLWHINHEVSKLSGVSLSRVEEVLDAAEKELSHDLGKWLASHKGDDRFTPQVYRNALVQIRGTLDHIRNSTDDGMASALQYGGAQAGKLATSHLAKEVMTFSQKFEHSVRPIAFEAASVIADGKKLMWPKFSNSAKRYAGQVGDDIRKQLAIGLVRGETLDQLTDRLAKLGGPKGYVYLRGQQGSPGARGEMIAEGLFKRYRHWAERLAVTETVNAYNETAMIGMSELEDHDPGYFKRWDAAIDGRTCPFCKQYDDLVTPIDKPFEGVVDHPPLHPRCRCAVVVWRKEWDESHYKDDLIKETIQGKEPKGVASIPHVIHTPESKKKERAKPPKPAIPPEAKPKKSKKPERDPDLKAALKMSEESRAEFSKKREEFTARLTEEEHRAIKAYSGSDYRFINGTLRKPQGATEYKLEKLAEFTKHIDTGLDKSKAKEDMLVYRATEVNLVKMAKLKPGTIFQDLGYMSTSSDPSVASANGTFGGSKGTIFHIEVPKGTTIAPIPTNSPHEIEWLLPRGTKLEVISIEDHEFRQPALYDKNVIIGTKTGNKLVRARIVYDKKD